MTQLFLYDIESEKTYNLNPNDSVENILAAWSPDKKYLLYETYALDVFPFASELRILEIETLEIQELGIKGFNPIWVWK